MRAPLRQFLVSLAALTLGCGTLQPVVAPEDVLTDGKQPRTPTERDLWWCRPPQDFPREIMLVVGDTCWLELDTTQAQCAEHKRGERGWRYMLHGGRCWWLDARKPEREPTSSAEQQVPKQG